MLLDPDLQLRFDCSSCCREVRCKLFDEGSGFRSERFRVFRIEPQADASVKLLRLEGFAAAKQTAVGNNIRELVVERVSMASSKALKGRPPTLDFAFIEFEVLSNHSGSVRVRAGFGGSGRLRV